MMCQVDFYELFSLLEFKSLVQQLDKQNIYEMILLEGMVLSYMEKSFKEILPLTESFLNKVDNWAQIDSTVCNFKSIVKEKEDVLIIVKRWLKSDKEYSN